VRGDARNMKLRDDHLRWSAEQGELVARFELPGLRQRDIVVLTVERELSDVLVWRPAAWGVPGWAELKAKGDDAPAVSEVDFNGRSWFVEGETIEAAGGQLTVRFGEAPAPAPGWSHDGVAKVRYELKPEADIPPGEPPFGETAITWTVPIGPSGAHAIPWPADATERSCKVLGNADALIVPTDHGCAVTEAGDNTALQASWTIPRVMLAGELGPQSRGAPGKTGQHASFSPILTAFPSSAPTLFGPAHTGPLPTRAALEPTGRIDVEVVGKGVSFRGELRHTGHAESATGEGSLKLSVPAWDGGGDHAVPPHLGWWVTAVRGQPMLSDRDAVLQAVARTALAASLPEPGLPARLRLRSGAIESVPELRRLLRSQVRTGQLPDKRSLQPDRLVSVRKATYGTEWEQALILARYLRQLRLDAVPMPVRPRGHADTDPGAPSGYDHAVVLVRLADQPDLWLDPACPVCDLGELRPELWGGRVLDASLERLPDAPGGQLVESVDIAENGEETVTFRLTGDAALSLRQHLLRFPLEDRGTALGELLGGTVQRHSGLGEPGAEVEVVVARTGIYDERPPAERLQVPDGAVLRLPWTGTRTRQLRVAPGAPEVVLAGAGKAQVDGAGLSWSRTVGTEADGTRVAHEALHFSRGVVLRDDLLALKERMATAAAPVVLEPPAEPSPAPTAE